MSSHIAAITLPESATPFLEAERRSAIADLTQSGFFQPHNDNNGPYTLDLSLLENKLVLRLHNADKVEIPGLILSLNPYKRLIQDYFLMIHSYETARVQSTREKLEAIDMARRALHNEGAALFIARLEGKITMDFDTGRRLFTLICALHSRYLT